MNQYIQRLKQHLDSKQINYEFRDAESILDMLYYAYISENPVENESITARFMELESILCQLTLDENNRVFDITIQLCSEYAHRAFLVGVHAGARLYTELSDTSNTSS